MEIITGSTGTPHVTAKLEAAINCGIMEGTYNTYGGLTPHILNMSYSYSSGTLTINRMLVYYAGRYFCIETAESISVPPTGDASVYVSGLVYIDYQVDQNTGYESVTLATMSNTGGSGSMPVAPVPDIYNPNASGVTYSEIPLFSYSGSGDTNTLTQYYDTESVKIFNANFYSKTTMTLEAGETNILFTGNFDIEEDTVVELYTDDPDVNPTSIVSTYNNITGCYEITYTFEAQDHDVSLLFEWH